ncbi:hypothetical protein GBAR_LOCUS28596, partial [Geodia barretti]
LLHCRRLRGRLLVLQSPQNPSAPLCARPAASMLPLTICRMSYNDAETLNPNLPTTAAVNLPELRGRVFFVPRGTTGSLASVVGIAISLADVFLADPSYLEDRR